MTPAETAVGSEGLGGTARLGGEGSGGRRRRRQRPRRPLGFPDGCAAKDLQPEPLAGPVLQPERGSSPWLPGPGSGPPGTHGAAGTAAGARTPRGSRLRPRRPPAPNHAHGRAAANPSCPDAWEQVPVRAPLGAGSLPLQPISWAPGEPGPYCCPPALGSWSGCSCGRGRGKGSHAPRGEAGGCPALPAAAEPDGDPSAPWERGGMASTALLKLVLALLHRPKASSFGDTQKRPRAPRHPSLAGFNPLGGRNPAGDVPGLVRVPLPATRAGWRSNRPLQIARAGLGGRGLCVPFPSPARAG